MLPSAEECPRSRNIQKTDTQKLLTLEVALVVKYPLANAGNMRDSGLIPG